MTDSRVCSVCGGRADCHYRSSDYCISCFGPLLRRGRLRGSGSDLEATGGRVSDSGGVRGSKGRVSEETE